MINQDRFVANFPRQSQFFRVPGFSTEELAFRKGFERDHSSKRFAARPHPDFFFGDLVTVRSPAVFVLVMICDDHKGGCHMGMGQN